MDTLARLLRYLCFSCGSQGVQAWPTENSREPSCPRCGAPVAIELEKRPVMVSNQ